MSEQKPWIAYEDCKPAKAGAYEWRVQSSSLDGLILIVAAHMRERGAGYETVLSPTFDYWDGYTVHVPKGLKWREASPQFSDIKWHETLVVEIEGVEFGRCIYCGKAPVINGVERAASGGTVVCSKPHRWNSWWLSCCEWGHTPHLSDPREIERVRSAAIANAKGL